MESGNWTRLVEAVGTLAIVVGLFLVAFELRQAHSLARAELSAESGRIAQEITKTRLDPAFASIIEKSQLNPAELTRQERIQLNAYLDLVIGLYIREWYNYNRGFFENYTDFPRGSAAYFFGAGYGKSFWESRKSSIPPELVEVVDRYAQDSERVNFWLDLDKKIVDGYTQ